MAMARAAASSRTTTPTAVAGVGRMMTKDP